MAESMDLTNDGSSTKAFEHVTSRRTSISVSIYTPNCSYLRSCMWPQLGRAVMQPLGQQGPKLAPNRRLMTIHYFHASLTGRR
jgi:hypothetical protein